MILLNSVYFFLVATLSIVDGILRVRLGAGWELSTLAAMLLLVLSVLKSPKLPWVQQALNWFFCAFCLLFISNLYGIYFYTENLTLDLPQKDQIHSITSRLVVESIRYLLCIFVFFYTYFSLNSVKKIGNFLTVFLYGTITQGIYGLYELLIKITGLAGTLPLLRGQGGKIESMLRVFGTFFEPSNFGQFIACGLFIYIGCLQLVDRGYMDTNVIYKKKFFVTAILISAIMASFSRTAFLAIFLAVLLKFIADILSFRKKRFIVATHWILSWAVILSILTALIIYFGDQDFIYKWKRYTFDLSYNSDYENTSSARAALIAEMASDAAINIARYPLGIGQGMAFIKTPFSPFIIRLPQEIGLIPFLFFVLICIAATWRSMKLNNMAFAFLPAFICLWVILINYNTTNHIWLWFCAATIIKLSSFKIRTDICV